MAAYIHKYENKIYTTTMSIKPTYNLPLTVLVTQSYPTLCNPLDCNLPGSSVHGIIQARISGMGCQFLLQGIFLTQEWNSYLTYN